MNSRPLGAVFSEYEWAQHARRALFDGFTAERLDELEDATGDPGAATAAVAVRLATLTNWQTQLRELETAAHRWPALRPFLDGQHAEWQAAYERTTSAFTTWHFHGWATLPDTDTGETNR